MKKSIAFLLASLATTSSLLFHTQEAKAGIEGFGENECSIKISAESKLFKARSGRYKGDYVIVTDFRGTFREPIRPVGKDEERAKKSFEQHCKRNKN